MTSSPLRVLLFAAVALVLSVRSASAEQAMNAAANERLVWDQPASSADELAGLAFVAYVDGRRQRLPAVSCASVRGPDGYECSSALPSLTPGEHLVEIAAYVTSGPQSEGYRSAAIRIGFRNQAAGVRAAPMTERAAVPSANKPEPGTSADTGEPPALPALERTWTTSDGVRFQAAVVASGLEDPTDLLPLPDGRLLVAERGGRVRVVRDGAMLADPAATLDDIAVGDGRGLLAMALAPDFQATRHVFAIYTTNDGLRLARFTVLDDHLVDHAVLLEGLPVSAVHPAAVLRSGPDGWLYLALDDGGDRDRVQDLGSYSGKVLRLALDGTTPEDQPGMSPLWSTGVEHPVGMAWSADRATLRLVGVAAADDDGPEASPAIGSRNPVRRLSLPRDLSGSAAAGTGSASALRDNLLIASLAERGIFRVWFASGDVPGGSEWLLRDLPGPVTALAVAPDGSIYAAVGPALLRIVGD